MRTGAYSVFSSLLLPRPYSPGPPSLLLWKWKQASMSNAPIPEADMGHFETQRVSDAIYGTITLMLVPGAILFLLFGNPAVLHP